MHIEEFLLDVGAHTDVGSGRRYRNVDGLATVVPQDAEVREKKGALFIVADDDGNSDGQFTVNVVETAYYHRSQENILDTLLEAMQQGNVQLCRRRIEQGFEWSAGFADCTSTVVHGDMLYGAHVGSGHAYLVHQGSIKQLTPSHTAIEKRLQEGSVQFEEVRTHSERYWGYREVLGSREEAIPIDTFVQQIHSGDAVILCTDGLWHVVANDEVRALVEQFEPQQSAERLIQLANERDGDDNVTVIVVKFIA